MNVSTLSVVESRIPIEFPNAFEYRIDKRHKWIQRVCFWILKKIGARYVGSTANLKTYCLNFDDIVQAIFDNEENIRAIYNKRPKYIVCGASMWQKLVNDSGAVPYILFNLPGNYRTNTHPSMEIGGMRVVVVPWIEGLFCLPDLDE